MTPRHKLFIAATALVALVVAAIPIYRSVFTPTSKNKFSPTAWAAAEDHDRYAFCDDLIAHHLSSGTSRAAIESLLGKPDPARPSHQLGKTTLVYFIGNLPFQGMDDAFLYIHLDANDQLLKAEVFGY